MPISSDPDFTLTRDDVPGIRAALTRYRVMAWVVGTLLVLLVCVAMPLKYFADSPLLVTIIGVAHGWLYVAMLITAYDLGRRLNWAWTKLLWIVLAGLVPFVTFWAEHVVTRETRQIAENLAR